MSNDVLQVLKASGLKQEIDQETFQMIARSIDHDWSQLSAAEKASDSSPVKDQLWNMAMNACICLRENADSLHSSEMYQELKTLTFVPATKVGNARHTPACFTDWE